jgi:PASTA domain
MAVAAAVAAAVLTVAAVGCGGSGGNGAPLDTVTNGRTPTAAGVTRPGEPTQTASHAEEASHEGLGVVPNETGTRLSVAEQNMRQRAIPYRLISRHPSDGAAKGDWTVCETNPAPRTHLESGTVVRLIAAPACD